MFVLSRFLSLRAICQPAESAAIQKDKFPLGRARLRTGFTLIEILIYIGLFSLVIGGLLFSVYGMIQGSSRLQKNVVINEEATFLLRKLDWALMGASAIVVPSSDRLEVTKPSLVPSENPLVFTLASGRVMLARGAGSAVPLTSASVSVSPLVFTEIPAVGPKPAALTAQFTLTHALESRTFETTKYLRQ